ncbi:MAG: hypothetical protein JXA01_05430 [Dehalococcoidia bacterium]|nr:hypothetical protein [Dehalococcoidia bacterium]
MALLIVCLLILSLIILILVSPVYVETTAVFRGRADLSLKVHFIFHLFYWELKKQKPGTRKNRITESQRKSIPVSSRLFRVVQISGLWDKIKLLYSGLAAGIKVRDVESDIIISLGDDYYSGMMIGLLLPLILFLNSRFSTRLELHPAFEEDLLIEGYLRGIFQMRPIMVLLPLAAFVFSRPGWKALCIMVRDK